MLFLQLSIHLLIKNENLIEHVLLNFTWSTLSITHLHHPPIVALEICNLTHFNFPYIEFNVTMTVSKPHIIHLREIP